MLIVPPLIPPHVHSTDDTPHTHGIVYPFVPRGTVLNKSSGLYPPMIPPLFDAETDFDTLLRRSIQNPFANIRVRPTTPPIEVLLVGSDIVKIPFNNFLQNQFSRGFEYVNPSLLYRPSDGRARVFRGVLLIDFNTGGILLPISLLAQVYQNNTRVHSATSKDTNIRIFGEWIFYIEDGDDIYISMTNEIPGIPTITVYITRLELIISVVE